MINPRIVGFALGMLIALGSLIAWLWLQDPGALALQPGDPILFLMLSGSSLGGLCIYAIYKTAGEEDPACPQ